MSNKGSMHLEYTFFYKKIFYKKMNIKNPKTWRKC